MEADFSVEKGICFFLLVLNGIDNTVILNKVVWGISCFVIKELGIAKVGLFSGLLGGSFCLGKLAGLKLVPLFLEKVHIKWVLVCLYFLSACASLFFGFVSYLGLALICRFLSGVFANSQFAVRKLLKSLDYQAKENDSDTFQKALYYHRLGGCIGVLLGSFLTNCEDFMLKGSQFVEKKFLLIFLVIFLVNFSGVLLVFSVDSKAFTLVELKNNYFELAENKENKESENPENGTKEKSDLANYLQSSAMGNEHISSEESAGPEEVKFYSPREGPVKEVISRKLNTARPKNESSFSFPEVVAETKEQEKPEGEGKKTHISFIEDELEEIQKEAAPQFKPVDNIEKLKDDEMIKNALKIRILITVAITFVYEGFPVTVYSIFQGKYETGGIIFLVYFIGVGGYYVLIERIMMRYSVSFQMIYFCGLMFVLLAIFPVLYYCLSRNWYLLVLLWVGWMFCIEGIMGIGNIITCDSVTFNEREDALDKSNRYALCARVLVTYVSSLLVWVLGSYQIGYLLFALFFGVLFWVARRFPKLYPVLSEVPYK